MQRNIIKDTKKFSFHCLDHVYLVKMNGKKDLGNKTFMQKTFKLSLLEKHDQIPISEKENEL